MTTGIFTNFNATFQHTSILGGQELSLVEAVEIFELIHIVRLPLETEAAMLVNEHLDPFHYPDTIHTTSGDRLNVCLALVSTTNNVDYVSSFTVNNTLNINMSATNASTGCGLSWSYVRFVSPVHRAAVRF